MGQKVNPNILRLGVNKTWKTEFFEKKRNELPLYTFKDLEIKSYIDRFLEVNGIMLHDYKQYYSNSTLNLYVSYFLTPDFFFSSNKEKSENVVLINKATGYKKKVSSMVTGLRNKRKPCFIGQQVQFPNDIQRLYELKKYYTSPSDSISFNYPQKAKQSFVELKKEATKVNSVLLNMFSVLSLFTNNQFNIDINFSCINKDLNFLKATQKKTFLLLQKFRNTPFLKDGIELLFHVICNRNSSVLLAKFIANQFQKTKRHKFFLSFLKQSLSIMLNTAVSKVKGIKIVVKGRLNGVPRAKHKVILIGDVPVQSISEKIDYFQTATHNSNGSYGIKVWIVEK